MKVLHVIPSLAAAHGGPTLALNLMERALTLEKIGVETATTDDDGLGGRNGKRCGFPLRENGVTRRYFPLRLGFYKVSPGFARWVFRHVGDYDLLHIHALFSFTSLVAALAAHRAGVPYVVNPHGSLNRYGITQRRPWLKRLSTFLIEGPILRNAAAAHFTSTMEKQEAEQLGFPLRAVVIPLGIWPQQPADGTAMVEQFPALRGSRQILFLSRLDPKKNVEGLLEAFKLISAKLPDTKLVIAGSGHADYVARLELLAVRLGIANRVIWTGYLEGELKASAFASALVFALPSHSENFGIAVVEAMMAGLPAVLGSAVAIAGETSRAGAALCVETDPESIAGGLSELLTDEPLRVRMAGRAAALASERFSAATMGAGLAGLYQKITSADPARSRPASA